MTQAHILIIDDDTRLRNLLTEFFRRNGYLATGARDAAHARGLIGGLAFDLMVMDVMMNGEDGISLCTDLRSKTDIPVILLTARTETADRIAGLEAGADDYLCKPFDPKELLLRVAAILRRRPDANTIPTRAAKLNFGPFTYDPNSAELWHGDDLVHITGTEAQLLSLFCAHPGRALAREFMIAELGRDQSRAQERAIDVQITRLRKKIEPDPKAPQYLQTVRGEGYVLVCK